MTYDPDDIDTYPSVCNVPKTSRRVSVGPAVSSSRTGTSSASSGRREARGVMILVHASPTTLEPYRTRDLGILSSPRRFYRESENIESWRWAADNDAFSKWDEDSLSHDAGRHLGAEGLPVRDRP